MDSVSVNQFRDKLKVYVEKVINKHIPLRVTRRNGNDFVVISAEDWEREQETLYSNQESDVRSRLANLPKT
jgi:antitoxin YefM